MGYFKWYRKWRGGYWIYTNIPNGYIREWQCVTKGRYDAYNMCSVLYGGSNEKEYYEARG